MCFPLLLPSDYCCVTCLYDVQSSSCAHLAFNKCVALVCLVWGVVAYQQEFNLCSIAVVCARSRQCVSCALLRCFCMSFLVCVLFSLCACVCLPLCISWFCIGDHCILETVATVATQGVLLFEDTCVAVQRCSCAAVCRVWGLDSPVLFRLVVRVLIVCLFVLLWNACTRAVFFTPTLDGCVMALVFAHQHMPPIFLRASHNPLCKTYSHTLSFETFHVQSVDTACASQLRHKLQTARLVSAECLGQENPTC